MNETPVDIQEHQGVPNYGAIINPTPDPRNHSLAAYTPILADAALPLSYSPNIDGIPHWDQNRIGACVGHAAGKAKQVAGFHHDGTIRPYSARFLYAMAKALEGTLQPEGDFRNFGRTASANDGTYPELVAKIMQKYGVGVEADVPNNTLLTPDAYVYNRNLAAIPGKTEAARHKISNYAFAPITVAGIKTAIQFAGENNGLVFMLTQIDKNWWTKENGQSSWLAKDLFTHFGGLRPPNDPASLGGHETYPFAFDTIAGRVQILDFNSWGDDWGNGGNAPLDLADWLPHIIQVITCVDLPDDYTAPNWTYTFTKAMKQGDQNSDVVALQHALRIEGCFPATQSFTGYFGSITLDAVKKFQTKYASDILSPVGLTQPTGFVGTMTLKKLNALFAA